MLTLGLSGMLRLGLFLISNWFLNWITKLKCSLPEMPASCISNKESLVVQRIQWDNLENEEIFEFICIKIFMTRQKIFINNFENFEGLFKVRNVWINTKTSTHWYDGINGRVWNGTFFISKFIEITCFSPNFSSNIRSFYFRRSWYFSSFEICVVGEIRFIGTL